MSHLDQARLGTFFGVLVGLAIAFEAISLAVGVSMVELAPIYMFTPMVAGAVTVWRSDVGFSEVGLRLGRYRWLVVAALVPLVLVYATLGLSLLLPGIGFEPGVDLLPGVDLPGGIPGPSPRSASCWSSVSP